MNDQQRSLETIQDIKKMMERSSRFISLSGWSGVAAGACALVGAFFARTELEHTYGNVSTDVLYQPATRSGQYRLGDLVRHESIIGKLVWIAIFTFIAAFVLAFLFTWLRSKKQRIPLFGAASMRLMVSVVIPLAVGGIFLLKALGMGYWELVTPGCLIFYGLALVNGSKFTLGEVKYLGYVQIMLGIVNLWFIGYGLYFWAIGFGLMHIVYGLLMWWKYERTN